MPVMVRVHGGDSDCARYQKTIQTPRRTRPSIMTKNKQPRVARETAFHDTIGSPPAPGFYAIINLSVGYYVDTIATHIRPGQRVLEYGCGKDGLCFGLAERRVLIDAIDISSARIEAAKKIATARGIDERIKFWVMDAHRLRFPDQHFDGVFGSSILHHLNLPQALAEIRRVLKPNGHAVFFEPLGHNGLINLYRKLTPHRRTQDEHPLLCSDLRLLADFFSVKITYFHLLSLAAAPLRHVWGFRGVLRFLDTIDQGLFTRVPASRKLAWIAVIELSS